MKEKIQKWLTDSTVTVDDSYGGARTVIIAEPDDILELAQELEPIVNQEVERRIAERMPSEEDVEINLASFDEITNDWFDFTHAVYHWLRSRLTPQVTPQDTHQVEKTEGGGE